MSTFYHIDSTWRDRDSYPNPAEFVIPGEVTSTWKANNRTVQAVRSYCEKVPLNFVYNVALLNLTLPFSFTTTQYGNNPPFLYVEFRNTSTYTDTNLINTNEIGNDLGVGLKDAIFVVFQDKVLEDEWISFKTTMVQTYRIDPKAEMKFRVFTNYGETVQITDDLPPDPPNPLAQVSALFQFTPYVREDTRESHYPQIYTC